MRNFKMKKLLIASTALVATAGMATADITLSGSAAAGYHSGMVNKVSDSSSDEYYVTEGIYSEAGVVISMSGATDNGITFSTSIDATAGNGIDAGDFHYDGDNSGSFGLGAVVVSGAFGTLTFDNDGIDNLYSDSTTHDISYATTLGAVDLTIGYDASENMDNATSASAGYTTGGMTFTAIASEAYYGTSTNLAVSYALNDTVTITADTDHDADKYNSGSVQSIGASTTLNGVSVSVETANNNDWDLGLGYSAGGFALSYSTDESDAWEATASTSLGGGATFAAGINADDAAYAGLSFAF